jgi:hypothetical protein
LAFDRSTNTNGIMIGSASIQFGRGVRPWCFRDSNGEFPAEMIVSTTRVMTPP